MSSRLSKWFLLGTALMIALPVAASASTSRIESMSLQGDYIKDYTAIYTYLSQVPAVGNLVYGELGNATLFNPTNGNPYTFDRSVGAVLGNLWDGKYGTWAVHLRQETPQLGQGDALSQGGAGFGGADPNHNVNESFDLMWGKKFGTTNFGLRLNRSFFNLESGFGTPTITTTLKYDYPTAGNPNLSRNIMGYGAGMGFELNPQTSIEVSLLYQSRSFEASVTPAPPGTKTTEDSPTTYMLASRMMWQWQPDVLVVPVFKWYSFDLSQKTTGAVTSSYTNTLKGWQIGAAGNWTLGSNDLFVLGATVAQNTVEQQQDLFGLAGSPFYAGSDTLKASESMMPQVFAALETHINSWLTLRFGAQKGAFHKVKIESKGAIPGEKGNTETSFSSFNMNIGAGVKLGALQLDAILANNFPQTLGWLGSGQVGTYFPKVTATYPF